MSVGVHSTWAVETEPETAYRPLSALAVGSCIWAAVSLFALVAWPLLVLPTVGIAVGIWAWLRARAKREAIAGERLALAGLLANTIVLIASFATLAYVHAQEVPPGCIVVDYDQLQPSPSVPGQKISDRAKQLDGQRVLLKGYALAGRHAEHIKQFVLMRDNMSCCFGGNPKRTDMVAVSLVGDREWTYSTDMLHVAGTFHVVEPSSDGRQPVYKLDADYVR